MTFEEKFKEYRDEFENVLNDFCDGLQCRPQILCDSLKYSLQLGGKRLRPVLTFVSGDLLGVERQELYNFALAIELIHTYSLIHDDLPEMDNDDFRRGKPSNHKVFGTGNAVLAGDGLLNTAYSILFKECRKGEKYISAAEYICNSAGIYGMIAGQSADLFHQKEIYCEEESLNFIYANKTGRLITAPLLVASFLTGGKRYSELKYLGQNLGYLFQLTDDILDVEGSFEELGKSIGKDSKEEKCSAVSVFGLEEAKLRADFLAGECLKICEVLDGDVSFLKELVNFVRSRKN